MRKIVLSVLAMLSAMAVLAAVPALALSPPVRDNSPYWILMRCDADMPSCDRPAMAYQPGQSLAANPAGSYFYYTPRYEQSCDGHQPRWHRVHPVHHRVAPAHVIRHVRHHRVASPAIYYRCRCGHTHLWWPAD